MKKVALILLLGIVGMTGCAQKKGGERGPRQGGHMVINKDSDSVFVALKQEALGKFKQRRQGGDGSAHAGLRCIGVRF